MKARDYLATGLLVVLIATPFWMRGAWRGTDDIAADRATRHLETPAALTLSLSPEVQSGLLALQAAIGAAVLGFLVGYRRGAARRSD